MPSYVGAVAVALTTAVVLTSCGGGSSDSPTQPTNNAVASVTIAPSDSVMMKPGGSAQLAVAVRGANGSTLTGKTITWSTGDNSKVGVSQSGQLSAVAIGRTTITATSEGKSGSTVVVVANPLGRDF